MTYNVFGGTLNLLNHGSFRSILHLFNVIDIARIFAKGCTWYKASRNQNQIFSLSYIRLVWPNILPTE